MASLNIRVGASVDRNLQVAYRPLVDAAKKAAAAIESEGKKGARGLAKETKKGVDEVEAKFRELEKQIKSELPPAMDAGTKAIQQFGREAKSNFTSVKSQFASLAKEAEQAMAKVEASERKIARMSFGQKLGAIGSRAWSESAPVRGAITAGGRAAMGIGRAGASLAFGVGRDMARGYGVDTSLSSIFGKNADLEEAAAKLSNAGIVANDPRNKSRVDTGTLMREALTVGKSAGMDANDALEGLNQFVGKTGDLATGRDILAKMAVLSKATGTELSDMVSAAGDVALALGDVPNKGAAIENVMRSFTAQGKLGAVEIKNLSKDMAKLAAQAGMIEGDVGKNIIMMGAFAQSARAHGGAATATIAAGSAASLISTFQTPARIHAFQHITGKDVFDKKTGKMRNTESLVLDALRAAGSDQEKWNDIFKNVQGRRAVAGYQSTFLAAGGGEEGIKAVEREMERMREAMIRDEEVMNSFAQQMDTGKSKAEVFNQTMRESALKLQEALLPVAQEAMPSFVKAIEGATSVLTTFIGNDAATRNNENKVDKAGENTRRQLANGYIVDDQQRINAEAEKLATEAAARRGAEAKTAKEAAAQSGKFDFFRDVAAPIVGGAFGQAASLTGGMSARGDRKRVTETDEANRASQDRLSEIKATNEVVANLLRNHVISVKVTEDNTKPKEKPPGIDPAGRKNLGGTPEN